MSSFIRIFIKVFTSLRLTVVLLAFAIVLVFVGPLAQVDEGLYNAQERYFRQWPIFGLNLFGQRISLLLPGEYLIGTLLVINLVCAHVYRFRLTTKKIGIQLAHGGVILLIVGQLGRATYKENARGQFIGDRDGSLNSRSPGQQATPRRAHHG